jgi:hypothetical protein
MLYNKKTFRINFATFKDVTDNFFLHIKYGICRLCFLQTLLFYFNTWKLVMYKLCY